jgi:hypothetical protein
MAVSPNFKKWCWRIVRWNVKGSLLSLLLLFALLCGYFAPQLYHHFILFPRQAAAWKDLAAQRKPVQLQSGLTEYRCVMHSHSHVSHDSEVQGEEIVAAMKKADCQAIFMTDHVVDGKADYSLGWKGMHDGVLFIRGFEMNNGFMPWGLPDDTVIDASEDPAEMAKKIKSLGGVICFGHAEAQRPWQVPEVNGMEIYNIHTDLLDELMEKHSQPELLKEVLVNLWAYPDQTLRHMFDEWVLMMLTMQWDYQSQFRKVTGIAANDCHQNVGARFIYTPEDTLLILDTGHSDPEKKVGEYKLNAITRNLLKVCFGPLEPGKELLRLDFDPYERSSRFVNTHLLAKELTEPALVDAVRNGRAFIAFNMVADASGFAYVAEGNGQKVTMGDQIALAPGMKLRAEAPLPCRFKLIRDGKPVAEQNDKNTFEFNVTQPGKYRLTADLKIVGKWTPWILANPIEITGQTQ